MKRTSIFILLFTLSGYFSFAQIVTISDSVTEISNLKSYYFPFKNFKKETYYIFVNINDTTEINVWDMQTKIKGADTFLITKIFDRNNLETEELTEQIVKDGSIMTAYKVANKDINNKYYYSDCTIHEDTIYKWKSTTYQPYEWLVNYKTHSYGYDNKVTLSKSRQLKGELTDVECCNNTYKSYLYYDNFKVETQPVGTTAAADYSYLMESYYAFNLGLAEYRIYTQNAPIKDFILIRVTTIKP